MDAKEISEIKQKMAGVNPATDAQAQQLLRAEALKHLKAMAVLGIGGGAAARGIYGLAGLVSRNRQGDAESDPYAATSVVNVPRLKSAAGPTSVSGQPWYFPAMAASMMAFPTIGWKGVGALLKRRRKAVMQDEIDAARQEYEQSLQAELEKTGSDSLNSILDEAYDSYKTQKQALAPWLTDLTGKGIGALGLMAMITGVPSFAFGYERARRQSTQSALEKARRRREQKLQGVRPSSLYAHTEELPAEEISE